MVHVSNITTQINLLRIFAFRYKIWNKFWGVTIPTVGIFILHKGNHQITAGAQTRTAFRSPFKDIRTKIANKMQQCIKIYYSMLL
jgi:hypothetical protein